MKICREYFISFNYVEKSKYSFGFGSGLYYSSGSIDCKEAQEKLDEAYERRSHTILYYKFRGWSMRR